MNALVLVFDQLHTAMLGPYGNTWVETPHWNRLASQSWLAEFCMADSPRLEGAYRALWYGRHAWLPDTGPTESLLELAARRGIHTTLVTDDPAVASSPAAQACATNMLVELPGRTTTARTIQTTQVARVLEAASEWLARAPTPCLTWVHARGLAGPWDAPLELRNQFAEEDDPLPPVFAASPNLRLPAGFDPDLLLGYVQACAGQTVAIDRCLGALADCLNDSAHVTDTLWIVTAARGFPLGEHYRIGPCDEALYSELLHIPLLIRSPDCQGAMVRSQQLVQPADVFATLADWLDLPADPQHVSGRSLLTLGELLAVREPDVALAVHDGQRLLRTPSWVLRLANGQRPELYVKPDDRTEANEISVRCPDVVEELTEIVRTMGQGEVTRRHDEPSGS